MSGEIDTESSPQDFIVLVQISHALVSTEALLKTCYWFSRDFVCDVTDSNDKQSTVRLKPKAQCDSSPVEIQEQFMSHAMDFALREQVTAKTSDVRDLLLAKAFSESGVLEEQPLGVFGDALEEAKPNGMFKILSNQ
jgi:His-Xaa-Ser system protein HxsD